MGDQIKARLEKASKPSEPPSGFKRMQIVEEDESDEEPAPAKPASPPSKKGKDELHPDIKVEANKQGIEKGKDKANSLFAQGNVTRSRPLRSQCHLQVPITRL